MIFVLLNFIMSSAMFFIIKKKKIVKGQRFLKCINLLNLVLIILLVICDLYFIVNKGDAIRIFFLYLALSSMVLILNIVFFAATSSFRLIFYFVTN